MQCPKLTPLQSRFAATVTATILLVILYLTLFGPRFAYAVELDSVLHSDHNHHRLLHERNDPGEGSGAIRGLDDGRRSVERLVYEPEFAGLDRTILGRQVGAGQIQVANNVPTLMNVVPGDTIFCVFLNATLWGNLSETGPGLPSDLPSRRGFLLHNGGVIDEDDIDEITEEVEEDVEKEVDSGLRKRQNRERPSRTVYISINTCLQPSSNRTVEEFPPQVTLYVSQSPDNSQPGPDSVDAEQLEIVLEEGFGSVTLEATGDIFMGIHGPALPDSFRDPWNVELAVSIDEPYHIYNDADPFLFFVDGDSRSALLVSENLTQAAPNEQEYEQWLSFGPPFTLFAHNRNNTAIQGLRRSFCGLQKHAQVTAGRDGQVTGDIEVGLTTRGMGNKPKQQFFIRGLNASSAYEGFLAIRGNATASGERVVGGGGQVWRAMSFFTKTDGNCQVIFNLTFCSEVAYAVPTNPERFPSVTDLTTLYDNNAAELYQNFSYSLQQIPCNASSDARYSLARDCDDCARDYKNWLCAVTIPRCADFSSNEPHLQPRNVAQKFLNGSEPDLAGLSADALIQQRLYANVSRNPLIDERIQPGPYKEVLPCEDLCYSLVQSCPAALRFACPLEGKGLEKSYGRRSSDGSITCSFLGAVHYLNGGIRVTGDIGLAVTVATAVTLMISFMA